jgi:hypothetical protein
MGSLSLSDLLPELAARRGKNHKSHRSKKFSFHIFNAKRERERNSIGSVGFVYQNNNDDDDGTMKKCILLELPFSGSASDALTVHVLLSRSQRLRIFL